MGYAARFSVRLSVLLKHKDITGPGSVKLDKSRFFVHDFHVEHGLVEGFCCPEVSDRDSDVGESVSGCLFHCQNNYPNFGDVVCQPVRP